MTAAITRLPYITEMAALSTAFERKVSSSEDALLLLKELVETNAPLGVIRGAIVSACLRRDLTNPPEQGTCSVVTSDMYVG
jgi:hypothetical protein